VPVVLEADMTTEVHLTEKDQLNLQRTIIEISSSRCPDDPRAQSAIETIEKILVAFDETIRRKTREEARCGAWVDALEG